MPVEKNDRRRRQYVPLVCTFAHGRTAESLTGKFGRDGLLVWVCYLAACKRAAEQGVFEYTSDAEGWAALGLHGIEPDFTLDVFFTYTGRLKKTSRRRIGRVTNVFCTRWEDYSQGVDRELDAARKRRKRGRNTPDTSRTLDGQSEDTTRTEVEVEGEVEGEKNPLPPTPAGRLFRLWQETWGHQRAILTEPRKRIVKRRLAEGFTEDTMRNAILGSKLDVTRWPERAEANAHTFELIFRDAQHIETFAELVTSPPASNGNHTETEEQREQRLLARLRQLGPKEAA